MKIKQKQTKIHYYQMLISSLLFLALACRPDITFVVIRLAKFASNPSNNHLQAIKRVFGYLKGTISLGIVYSLNQSPYLQGYCNADYARDISTAKSTTGYIFILAGSPII